MDIEHVEELREHVRDYEDEVLLDYMRYHRADFSPEALELIRGELLTRGYGEDDFRQVAQEPPLQPVDDDLELLAEVEDPMIAQQVLAILEDAGITAFTKGLEPGIWGYQAFPTYQIPLKIYVIKGDADQARDLLADFPPLADGVEDAG